MQIKTVHFETIDSTNTWAKKNASTFDPKALTVITADEQTSGRGRFKRAWVSPKGCNLYVTYVFFLDFLSENIGNIPQILALAAVDALQIGQIKWPNDIVTSGKKLGGILCEVEQVGDKWALICGIGININMPKELLESIDRPATSLKEELGQSFEVSAIGIKLHEKFYQMLLVFLKKGFAPFLTPFKKALVHKKRDYLRLHNFKEVIEGTFACISSDGSLELSVNGQIQKISTGELL